MRRRLVFGLDVRWLGVAAGVVVLGIGAAVVVFASLRGGGCRFGGELAQLQARIPDVVGNCLEDERARPEVGLSSQRTANGLLEWHATDAVAEFSDGARTWVLDPYGQVQTRGNNERFPFEFNGDGLPLVGQGSPNVDGPCPTAPLAVLAVENFYGNLVQQLGGQCVAVTTILSDPDADPHEFEPSAEDVRAFSGAALVIENGLGYDDFADKIIATLSTKPETVRAGDVVGLEVGANPHMWYSAAYVEQIKAATLGKLKQLKPDGVEYFDAQSSALDQRLGTYRDLVAQIRSEFAGTPIGATESIFEYLAVSADLRLISPPGFIAAVSEGADPSARDLAEFQDQIKNREIRVLVYNVQTVTPITSQLKEMAAQNGIPIVGVSETMPTGAQTFQGWQAAQMQLLLMALRQAAGR